MTSVDMTIERIRLSFEAGAVKKPTLRVEAPSEEHEALIVAMHELIARGLMDQHWSLTAAGREWASS